MVPVQARIGETEWYTALWPKEELYILPIKASIRKVERLEVGDSVRAILEAVKTGGNGWP